MTLEQISTTSKSSISSISSNKTFKNFNSGYSIPFKDIFPNEIEKFLDLISSRVGITKEFVTCPLLAAISHLMSNSSIQQFENYKEGFVIYSALVASPSTGKTTAMNLIKNALIKCETKLTGTSKETRISNDTGTIEATLHTLKKKQNILSLFDESSTFFASLGRNKSSSKYDRSLYSTLFNAPELLDRVLCNKSIILKKPRYNLCLLGHPDEYVDLIRKDVNKYDDGLMHRFIVSLPKSVCYLSRDIRSSEVNQSSIISLSSLFFLIMKTHQQVRNYYFRDHTIIDRVFDKYKIILQNISNNDNYISSMLGKNITYLLRFCGILQAIKNAFNFLKTEDIAKGDDISDEYNALCETHVQGLNDDYFLVDDETVLQADKLLDYFTCTKLTLAGYDFNFENSSFEVEIEKYISQFILKNDYLDKEILKVMLKTLDSTELEVTTKYLNERFRITKEKALEGFELLDKLGFGKIQVKYLESCKKNIKSFMKDSAIDGKKFTKNDILSKYHAYMNSSVLCNADLNSNQSNDENTQVKLGKRKSDDLNCISKKFKLEKSSN